MCQRGARRRVRGAGTPLPAEQNCASARLWRAARFAAPRPLLCSRCMIGQVSFIIGHLSFEEDTSTLGRRMRFGTACGRRGRRPSMTETRRGGLDDDGVFFVFIGCDANAVGFDSVDAVLAKGVVADGVFGGGHELAEPFAQLDEGPLGDMGFEDALLYTVAIVADRTLDPVTAAVVDYIIANEDEHCKRGRGIYDLRFTIYDLRFTIWGEG